MSLGRCCVPKALPEELQAKLDRCLPLKGKAPVLFIGDSMLARFQDYGTGRGLLDPWIFENAAVGGTTTNHWIHLLQSTEAFLEIRCYRNIVLMLGTNNLANLGASATEITAGLECVVEIIKSLASNAELLFVPIQHRWDLERPAISEEIEFINGFMSKLCSIVPFSMGDKSMFEDDMLHLTRAGYVQLAKNIIDTL